MGEIGLSSGFSYEQRLGSHFSLLSRVGLETMLWATLPDEIVFQGIYPSFRLSSRWYHSGKKRVGNINTGGYIYLEMGYVTGEWGGLFAKRLDGYSYNYSINIFQPTWGYNWAFNERWGLKFQTGLSFGQINYGYDPALGREVTRGWNAVVLDLGVLYVF